MSELTLHQDYIPRTVYKPFEIICIFNAILAKLSAKR